MFLAMGLERELGFRPRLRKRGPGFRFERVGYWLRFREKEKARFSAMKLERERERVGISAMDLERERERELTFNGNHLQSPPIQLNPKPPSATSTFTLRECLRFSPRERELGD